MFINGGPCYTKQSHTENEEQCTNRMSTSTAINKNHNIYQSTTVQSIDLLDQH